MTRLTKSSSVSLPTKLEEAEGDEAICEKWRVHYKTLFEGSRCLATLQNHLSTSHSLITAEHVADACHSLSRNKARGPDSLCLENILFCDGTVYTHLAHLFNQMLRLGHIPEELLEVVIKPIVKRKGLDNTKIKSYRPIALATALSKVLEKVLLFLTWDSLKTTSNQMGYKAGVGSEMAIFTLKSVITNAKNSRLPTYVCYLDASAAFDKVSHDILIRKLVEAGVPADITNLLIFWFDHQHFRVRWNTALSTPFSVRRGVRQGGVLSSYCFAFYLDALSHNLTATAMGCLVSGQLINHITYADDICLLASSIHALNALLRICKSFADSHDLEFNPDKTMLQCFLPPKMSHLLQEVTVRFCHVLLRHTRVVKYLGCLIEAKFIRSDIVVSNDQEFEKRCGDIYKRAYMIKSWFKKCSVAIKTLLFKTYLSNVYCSSLWDLTVVQLNKFKAVYNDAIRIIGIMIRI